MKILVTGASGFIGSYIVEVDGYGKCLVMEWIDGVTLEEWLLQHHSKAERVHIADQLLFGRNISICSHRFQIGRAHV